MAGVIRDRLEAVDRVTATTTREPEPIKHPCPKCGKGSRQHKKRGVRICAARTCRAVFSEGTLH